MHSRWQPSIYLDDLNSLATEAAEDELHSSKVAIFCTLKHVTLKLRLLGKSKYYLENGSFSSTLSCLHAVNHVVHHIADLWLKSLSTFLLYYTR
jgi:hypothetical protein